MSVTLVSGIMFTFLTRTPCARSIRWDVTTK